MSGWSGRPASRAALSGRQSGRVHVIEAGDGPPVVHLHGNNTSSLSHLMLLEHLTTVRSYLVDRPGCGLSDPDDFPRSSFRERAVRFVDDVLDELQLESAVVVGASGGGSWAVWYALDRPERVRGLVMLGSVPLLPGARIPLRYTAHGDPDAGQRPQPRREAGPTDAAPPDVVGR